MKKLLAVLACAVFLAGCSPAPKRYNAVYTDVFDTVTEFTAYCSSQEEFDGMSERVHGELLRLHEIFDIYNEYPGIVNACSLNGAGGAETEVPDDLIELINMGIDWHKKTGGQLNIALGSVLSLWHECRENGTLPDENELLKRAGHCDIEKIAVTENSVTLTDPGMSLDFGAIAKGYAVGRAAEILKENGLEDFAISCGGNVVTSGKKPYGKWEIGIENPDGGLITTVSVSDEAVVTSGDYQRFVMIDGKRYHHIIDPKTLYPAEKWRSVTVICPDSALADALSTSLFCLDLEDGMKLLEDCKAEAMWVSQDGEVTKTPGFEDHEK